MTSNGVGTCGPDDNQAQAGHLIAQCVMGERTHTLTSEGSDASEDGTGRGTPIVVHPLALRGRDGGAQLEVGPEGGPYNALRAGDGGSSRQSLVSISYAPEVAATLTAGTSASPGVNPPGRRNEDDRNIVALDLRNCTRGSEAGDSAGMGVREDGPSFTVTTSARAIPGVAAETVVRRLTPLECERLQGYPDGWTDGQADSARYRQLGNSIAVPVFEWVARRLVDEELS